MRLLRMNYNPDSLKINIPLIRTFLNDVSIKDIIKIIGITPTTARKYLKNINLLYKAPYRITSALIIEAIKYNQFTSREEDDTFAEFSKKAIIIGKHNNNLLSAKILLSEKYLSDNHLVLKQIANSTKIPYSSLKSYQSGRIALEDSSWNRIQILSQYKKGVDLGGRRIIKKIEKMLHTNEKKI